jgi:hypothetical protein
MHQKEGKPSNLKKFNALFTSKNIPETEKISVQNMFTLTGLEKASMNF